MGSNKLCVITGCSSGIGKYTAIELAKRGYELVMLVRDSQKSRDAHTAIREASGSEAVHLFYVDLASLASIREVAAALKQQFDKIDLLINNAGILKRTEELSPDGFELTLAVNYLAPVYLTRLLLPLVEKGENPRIINLSSELYKRGQVHVDTAFSPAKFNGTQAYADSKLLLLYFNQSLAERLANTPVTVNALHPGVVSTDVFREFPAWLDWLLSLFITSPEKGAEPTLYLATSEEVANITGAYFNKTQQADTAPVANDEALAEEIWEKTEELIGVDPFPGA